MKTILTALFISCMMNVQAQPKLTDQDLIGEWEIIYPFSESVDTINFETTKTWYLKSNNRKFSDPITMGDKWILDPSKSIKLYTTTAPLF